MPFAYRASVLFAVAMVGCGHAREALPPGACPVGFEYATAQVEVTRPKARPSVVAILRDGDPQGAVAAVVVVGESPALAAGLSGVVEMRLRNAGFANVEAVFGRESFRVRALVENEGRASAFVAAFRGALEQPIAADTPELAVAGQRIATLKRHPYDAPIFDSIAACTGEPGILLEPPSSNARDAGGAASLDRARRTAYAGARIALGVAGNASTTAAFVDAVRASEAWPDATPLSPAQIPPKEDRAAAYAAVGRPAGTAQLTLAFPTSSPDFAVLGAAALGAKDGALVARLRALPVPYRLMASTGAARLGGGCLSVVLESSRPTAASEVEHAAALAATVARQEVELLRMDPVRQTRPGALSPEGARAARLAIDPRQSAELAAWWSLAGEQQADSNRPMLAGLAVSPPDVEPRDPAADISSSLGRSTERFSAALGQLDRAFRSPVLERRERLERGQGELWVLLGSPCGTGPEGQADAGLSALAVTTVLAARGRGAPAVTVEPWVAPDGLGFFAHTARLGGESGEAMAARLAGELARTLAAAPFAPGAFLAGRGALLDRVGDGIAQDGRAFAAFAEAVVPGHPSWIGPLGNWDVLAKASVESASLRWAALSGGPVRVAVLANDDGRQADAVARTIDRWLVRSSDGPRVCPAVGTPPAPRPGLVEGALSPLATPAGSGGQALLGFAVPPQGDPDAAFAELTMAGLSGPDGWLARGLAAAPVGASAQTRLVGGGRAAALLVDVRAPEPLLDAAIAVVRGVLQGIRRGAITDADFSRSAAQRERWNLEAALDPRRRLVDLFRDVPQAKAAKPTSLDAWRAWASDALRDDKLIIAVARPKRG